MALLVACGGSPRKTPEPQRSTFSAEAGRVVGSQVLCMVGARSLGTDDVLTIAFWNEKAAAYSPDAEVVLSAEDGSIIGVALVHRINPDAGAMSLRIPLDQLIVDLPRGASFRMPLP